MTKSIKSRLATFFCCIYQRLSSGWGLCASTFVLPPPLNPLPFSDAELELCRDVLTPIGYTAIRSIATNEILVYREKDWREQEKAEGLILQQLKQDA